MKETKINYILFSTGKLKVEKCENIDIKKWQKHIPMLSIVTDKHLILCYAYSIRQHR